MSEFKFACPVCGQHIKCDSSQAGSQMDCPTCFQKITVPQAPGEGEQKFILTGTKKAERPLPTAVANVMPPPPRAEKSFPGALVVVLILVFIGGAVAFVYHGTIFRKPFPPPGTNATANVAGTNAPKTVAMAPPASDTNWMLNLDSVTIPDAPAAGRIHGLNFLCERANFQNGTLTIRSGTKGPVDFGLTINFQGAAAEAFEEKTINVTTNATQAARVTLRWSENGAVQRESFADSYAMRLEFGERAGNHMPGKIYLCTPDAEESYIAGTFTVDIRRPRPK